MCTQVSSQQKIKKNYTSTFLSFIAGVVDTGYKHSFAIISDLCHQYSLSSVSLTPAKIFSPVSMIPVIKNQKAWNLSPVSTTPPKKLFSGVNDTGDNFFGGVNDTGD